MLTTMMTILLIFAALSFISTVFVVSAGILSSRMNQRENWVEMYEREEQSTGQALPQAAE